MKYITKDGSFTLLNTDYNETYHPISGAIKGAYKRFIEPTLLGDVAKRGAIKILDVALGLGYNIAAAIEDIKKKNPDCIINITTLEKDSNVFSLIKKLNPNIKSYKIIKELAREYEKSKKEGKADEIVIKHGNIIIRALIGDAVNTISRISTKFDAVFLDPFSPQRNSELLSPDFLSKISLRMKKKARLATIIKAGKLKDSLKDAGLKIVAGTPEGRAPGIVAVK